MYNEINHGFVYLSSTLSHCFALVVIIFKHLGMVIHRINRLSGRAISIKFARYIKCHLSAKLHTCLLMQYNCLSTTQYILLSINLANTPHKIVFQKMPSINTFKKYLRNPHGHVTFLLTWSRSSQYSRFRISQIHIHKSDRREPWSQSYTRLLLS